MTVFRVATANTFDATVNRITQRSAELALTQERLSSGKRVLRATDDPVAATLAERESNRLMRTEADLRALERSRSSLQQAESTIGQMGEVLIRFKELLVQGGNASLSDSDRRSVALEMRGLRDQLLNLANTQDTEGNALLGGLGVINSSGKPFAELFGNPSPPLVNGVNFLAISGQAAPTETSLPNRVDGSFALMRVPSGDGIFEVSSPMQPQSLLVRRIDTVDSGVLRERGFFDPDSSLRIDLEIEWDADTNELGLVVRQVDLSGDTDTIELQRIGLGAAQSGQTIDLQSILRGSSVSIRDESSDEPDEHISLGFSVELVGSIRIPDEPSTEPLSQIRLAPSQNTNLFATLQRAIDALENRVPDPTDPTRFLNLNSTGLTQELGRVHQEMQTGQDRLLLVRGRLGELLRRADSIEGLLQDRSVAGQRELSNLTDLDMVKGISEFQTQQLGLQAALQSYAQVQRLSLFQFIA